MFRESILTTLQWRITPTHISIYECKINFITKFTMLQGLRIENDDKVSYLPLLYVVLVDFLLRGIRTVIGLVKNYSFL